MNTLMDSFARAIANLKSPEMFLGVARILKVELVEGEDSSPREFYDIWSDVLDKFSESPRKRKRELIKIVREAGMK